MRKEAGLTQRQLSERIKRPHSLIAMIETHGRMVQVPELIALCEALEVDVLRAVKRILREKRRLETLKG